MCHIFFSEPFNVREHDQITGSAATQGSADVTVSVTLLPSHTLPYLPVLSGTLCWRQCFLIPSVPVWQFMTTSGQCWPWAIQAKTRHRAGCSGGIWRALHACQHYRCSFALPLVSLAPFARCSLQSPHRNNRNGKQRWQLSYHIQ